MHEDLGNSDNVHDYPAHVEDSSSTSSILREILKINSVKFNITKKYLFDIMLREVVTVCISQNSCKKIIVSIFTYFLRSPGLLNLAAVF